MANTGYRIDKFKDVNPYSPTYDTTKTERVYDTDTCPNDAPIWEEISRECVLKTYEPSGVEGNNGKALITEEDVNQHSLTFGETRTREVNDQINCPLPNTEPEWELESSSCEQY